MSFEQNARELGIEIPEAPEPVAAHVPGVLVDGYIYTSGQLPFANRTIYKEKSVQKYLLMMVMRLPKYVL